MKISVAIATYNGEKYLSNQIDSILSQTVSVDEIIISDDGSVDSTLKILNQYNEKRIKILTDNPVHGYCYNFEYAIKNTTGDIIFLADQDDIWDKTKVEKTIAIFNDMPKVDLVISDGCLINSNNDIIEGVFNKCIHEEKSCVLRKDDYLFSAINIALANGMCMCFTNKIKNRILPFPDSTTSHDRWIAFCMLCISNIYFLKENLVFYRIHDTNTSMRGNLTLTKRYKKIIRIAYHEPYNIYNILNNMCNVMNGQDLTGNCEYHYALDLKKMYYQQIDALESSIVNGAIKLFKLWVHEKSYKSNGIKYFLSQLYLILFKQNYILREKRKIKC